MNSFVIHHGDALAVLRGMPDSSVNCCVTSPPYYGLRDYGVDGQIGLEETPEAYIAKLVDVFREVRRVLADNGTLWVNIGDSYAINGIKQTGRQDQGGACQSSKLGPKKNGLPGNARIEGAAMRTSSGCKSKDLIGIPWMLAFALRADGWYLRSEIIWHKPNPMPESVKDRPTKAHEQIFLLSKSPKYFYDAGAVLEPFTDKRNGNPGAFKWSYGGDTDKVSGKTTRGVGGTSHKLQTEGWNSDGSITGRNRRSVWTVTSKPYKEAHFATFPPDLIKPCILAGCPENGTVLDPFGGSGTTAQVAIENGRSAVLIELNPDYIKLIRKRLTGIATRPANVPPLLAVCEAAA